MTRTGSLKRIPRERAKERLLKALSFREVAYLALDYIDHLPDPSPIPSNAVLAVIAFTDAITIAVQEQVSQDDHQAAVKLLRDCLGQALPKSQESNLTRLLGLKTEVQYGAKRSRSDEAKTSVKLMDEFAEWVIEVLRSKNVFSEE